MNKRQSTKDVRHSEIKKKHAHQLRAPISNIIGLISLLEGESHSPLNTEIINMLKISALDLDSATKNIILQC